MTETTSEGSGDAEESAAESESDVSEAETEEDSEEALSAASVDEEDNTPYTFVDSSGNDIRNSGITQSQGTVTVDDEAVTYTTLTISASGSFTLTGDMDYYDIVLNPSSGNEDEIMVDLDLNGHTITGSGTTTVIIVKSGATLNFKDSTASESSSVSLNEVASLESSFVKSGNDTGDENLIWAIVKNEDDDATTYTTYYATIASVDNDGNASYTWSSYTSGAVTGGGVNTTDYIDGGGIRVGNGGVLNMSGGTICLNEVEGDGGGISIGNDLNWKETVETACSITGGMLSGNNAGTDSEDGGGGLYFECYTANKISNLALVGNYAYYGGGLSFNMSYGDKISGLTIVGNSAYTAGGMHSLNMSKIKTMKNIVLENNEAKTFGGGAGLQDCNIGKMFGVTVRKNTAGTYSGGIYLTNYYRNKYDGENVAIGKLCNIEVSWNEAGTYAGGMYISMCDVKSMSDIMVSENEAGTYAGGMMVYNSDVSSMSDIMVSENDAETYYAGGMMVYNSDVSSMSDISVSENGAETFAGGMMVYNSAVSSMSSVSVSENEAGTFGGGLVIEESKEISISGLEVTKNAAEESGGGIVVSGDTAVTISDSTISHNTAGASGGGLYVGHLRSTSSTTTSDVTVSGTVLANNLAGESADDVFCAAGNTLVLYSIADGLNANTVYEADEKELLIDGWYNDTSDTRYYKDGEYHYNLNTSDTFNNSSETSSATGDWYLVAAHSPYVLIYDGNEQSGGTVENVPTDSNTYDSVETGDSTNVMLWFTILAAAAAVVCILIGKKKIAK